MTQGDIQFNLGTLRSGQQQLVEIHTALEALVTTLQTDVGDASVFGTNDTLGSVASPLYEAALDSVSEVLGAVTECFAVHADNLQDAHDVYESSERDFSEASRAMLTLEAETQTPIGGAASAANFTGTTSPRLQPRETI